MIWLLNCFYYEIIIFNMAKKNGLWYLEQFLPFVLYAQNDYKECAQIKHMTYKILSCTQRTHRWFCMICDLFNFIFFSMWSVDDQCTTLNCVIKGGLHVAGVLDVLCVWQDNYEMYNWICF